MDIERTIEILLKNQARMDARFDAKFDRAEERFRKDEERFRKDEERFRKVEERFRMAEARLDRLERVVRLNNRVVSRLVRYGVSLRSDVRRLTQAQAGTDRALKTLIQTMTHRNGGREGTKTNGRSRG
jgi:hypothetical protein